MYYSNYKGIWYKYHEDKDVWSFSDRVDSQGSVAYYSNKYRWDQAYNNFVEELKEHNALYPQFKVTDNKCDEEFWKGFVDKWNKGLKEGSTHWATLKPGKDPVPLTLKY